MRGLHTEPGEMPSDEDEAQDRYNLSGEAIARLCNAAINGMLELNDVALILRIDGWSPTGIESHTGRIATQRLLNKLGETS